MSQLRSALPAGKVFNDSMTESLNDSILSMTHFPTSLQVHCLHRQIPMPLQNLEPPLLFALERRLEGMNLFLQPRLIERFVRPRRILEDDGHAEIPAPVFGSVIARLIHPALR